MHRARGACWRSASSLEEARKLIAGYDGRVSIGAVNGPEMLTLSGDTEPLQQIAQLLEARGVFNRPVRVQVPYHSHHMEPIQGRHAENTGRSRGRAWRRRRFTPASPVAASPARI